MKLQIASGPLGKNKQITGGVMSESSEQIAVVQWFRVVYPKLHLICIPNGQWIAGSTKKGKYALINKYKREGLTNGVSDLFLCHSDGQHHGLWLEMKDQGKTLSSVSKDQAKWLGDMRDAGYYAVWAAGQGKAKAIITDYINGYYKTGG